jgi:hypothetical protein
MGPNVILFGWNRPLPSRESTSVQHFQEFMEYLSTQKRSGVVESFDAVMLEPHGGTMNGFFLIRGEPAKLAELTASAEWMRHQVRALYHLDRAASVRGVTGAAVRERMELWTNVIQKYGS